MKRAGYRTVYKTVLILETYVVTVPEETHGNIGSAISSSAAMPRPFLQMFWATWGVRLYLAHSPFLGHTFLGVPQFSMLNIRDFVPSPDFTGPSA